MIARVIAPCSDWLKAYEELEAVHDALVCEHRRLIDRLASADKRIAKLEFAVTHPKGARASRLRWELSVEGKAFLKEWEK
jgi:hypothetical protein